MEIISHMPRALFHECIHVTLPNRWRKCIAAKGSYFEGDNITVPDDEHLLESSSEVDSSSDSD